MYNDADIELAELVAVANNLKRLERNGQCGHSGLDGLTCTRCGYTFDSQEQWLWAYDEASLNSVDVVAEGYIS